MLADPPHTRSLQGGLGNATRYGGNRRMAPFGIVESKAAWYGPAIEHSTTWQHRLSADQRAEVGHALDHLQATGRPLLETTRADFPLPTVGKLLRELLETAESGRGFLLLRNLPVETLSEDA